LQQQRDQWYSTGLQDTGTVKPNETAFLNIEKLVKEEFYKRVESIYMKQLVMADLTTSQRGKP
jgi:hypothetical protein